MIQLTITGDGSHTLFVPELHEHYHSTFGAVTESQHIFIRNGLDCFSGEKKITVLEVGFGTGLNALLTALNAVGKGIFVEYHALEKFPLDMKIVHELNYSSLLEKPGNHAGKLFNAIHQVSWNRMNEIHPCFHLKKTEADLCSYVPDFTFDLIYFDAFAPEKQAEMWTVEIMQRLVRHLNPGGIFITYCVKGSVRRSLKECGLWVEKVPGPPGKREILRGIKLPGARKPKE